MFVYLPVINIAPRAAINILNTPHKGARPENYSVVFVAFNRNGFQYQYIIHVYTCNIHTGYVVSSHSIQSYMKRVLKMLLSEPLASLILFSRRV